MAQVQRFASLSGPQRYKVQFTASEEYVALVDEAKALLAHALPSADLAEIHLRALRTFVNALKKRKYATATRSAIAATAEASSTASQRDDDEPPPHSAPAPSVRQTPPASPLDDSTPVLQPERAIDADSLSPDAVFDEHAVSHAEPPRSLPTQRSDEPIEPSRQRGRHVPAAVRRAVSERDDHRCAYVDGRGVRCRETSRLELHHHEPFARGGPSTPENLSLYCTAHNALAAERDFGPAVAIAKREHPHLTQRNANPSDATSR